MSLTNNITLVQSQSTSQGVLCSSCKVCQTEVSPDTDGILEMLKVRSNTNQEEEVKDCIEGVDDVEDIVRTDLVLVLVHQQEDPALQVNIEDDCAVQSGHLGKCQ